MENDSSFKAPITLARSATNVPKVRFCNPGHTKSFLCSIREFTYHMSGKSCRWRSFQSQSLDRSCTVCQSLPCYCSGSYPQAIPMIWNRKRSRDSSHATCSTPAFVPDGLHTKYSSVRRTYARSWIEEIRGPRHPIRWCEVSPLASLPHILRTINARPACESFTF